MLRKIASSIPEPIKSLIRPVRSRWFHWRFSKKGVPGILCGERFRFKFGYQPNHQIYNRFWEDDRLLQKAFIEAIRPGDTVLDVGAFVGHYTLLAARKVGPMGRVVAIEPFSLTYRILIEHLLLNGFLDRVDLWPIAAGNGDSFIKIYYQRHDPVRGHNSTNPSCFWEKGLTENLTSQMVPCVALGPFLDAIGIKPDVIKIDIEGAEIEALRSLQHILQDDVTVFCELHPHLWGNPEVQSSILMELMKKTGRCIVTLDGAPWSNDRHEPVILRKRSEEEKDRDR
jgi:FkbM family methyltransferase